MGVNLELNLPGHRQDCGCMDCYQYRRGVLTPEAKRIIDGKILILYKIGEIVERCPKYAEWGHSRCVLPVHSGDCHVFLVCQGKKLITE